MNNGKNFVIFVLSLIILVQSAFLVYFISRKAAPKEKTKAVRTIVPKEEAVVAPVSPPVATGVKRVPPVAVLTPVMPTVVGKIALVLDDWGYNLRHRDFITDNDFHVTLAVLPFRDHSTHIAQLAYHKDKDVIIHMPMEPHNKDQYGLEENTLLTSMDKKTVLGLLDNAFANVPYAKGISNHMGSMATEDTRLMKVVMGYLGEHGLLFLDSFVTPKSVCKSLARSFRVGFALREIFIDNESDEEYIRAQMLKLAAKAKRNGLAVGIGHDRPHTIAVLKRMIPELERQGYRFVNLSEIVEKR